MGVSKKKSSVSDTSTSTSTSTSTTTSTTTTTSTPTFNTTPDNTTNTTIDTTIPEKKKRGRKKQNVVIAVEESKPCSVVEEAKPPPKKRGRKPKGGKIVEETPIVENVVNNEPNIILHLRCSLADANANISANYSIKYDPKVENIQSFNFDNSKANNLLLEQTIEGKVCDMTTAGQCGSMWNKHEQEHECAGEDIGSVNNNVSTDMNDDTFSSKRKNVSRDAIWDKLNALKVNLHRNTISDKRSACFWCTHDFDNPPIFIPKHEFKNSYQVYGCFCSPECSVAHLMNEKIDSSVKFERYQLLNHIYGKIYSYDKNIKPAPDPHYLLEKFYGTLTINEYRDLFKSDQLLIVVEKPLTHVFPELYEDNNDFILNQRTIPSSSTFKLKRKGASSKPSTVLESLSSKKI
jgi:hypothetical protein